MSPLREFRTLTDRYDKDIKIEPLRRYYLIFEGANTESGSFFNKLKNGVELAINQEKSLEQDVLKLTTEIGSNVGVLIEQMREDPRDVL
jgi:hypothetical protein